jgi:hypothetical protein
MFDELKTPQSPALRDDGRETAPIALGGAFNRPFSRPGTLNAVLASGGIRPPSLLNLPRRTMHPASTLFPAAPDSNASARSGAPSFERASPLVAGGVARDAARDAAAALGLLLARWVGDNLERLLEDELRARTRPHGRHGPPGNPSVGVERGALAMIGDLFVRWTSGRS